MRANSGMQQMRLGPACAWIARAGRSRAPGCPASPRRCGGRCGWSASARGEGGKQVRWQDASVCALQALLPGQGNVSLNIYAGSQAQKAEGADSQPRPSKGRHPPQLAALPSKGRPCYPTPPPPKGCFNRPPPKGCFNRPPPPLPLRPPPPQKAVVPGPPPPHPTCAGRYECIMRPATSGALGRASRRRSRRSRDRRWASCQGRSPSFTE
jgi:hypothetical protein